MFSTIPEIGASISHNPNVKNKNVGLMGRERYFYSQLNLKHNKSITHHNFHSLSVFFFHNSFTFSFLPLIIISLWGYSNYTWHSGVEIQYSVTKYHKGKGGGQPKYQVTFFLSQLYFIFLSFFHFIFISLSIFLSFLFSK